MFINFLNFDFSTAKLSLPIDATAPSMDVTAHPMDVTAYPTDVTAHPIDVTAPSMDVTAPPINVTATVNYSRDLATLAKMYTEESKYSKEDDNFDHKLIIFNNLCNRVGIPQEAKIKGFPIMLRGITLNFYYKNKATYTTFNSICNAIYSPFKGPEYKRKVLIK